MGHKQPRKKHWIVCVKTCKLFPQTFPPFLVYKGLCAFLKLSISASDNMASRFKKHCKRRCLEYCLCLQMRLEGALWRCRPVTHHSAEMPKMSSVINWWGRGSVYAAVFKNWILQLKTKSERLTGALLLKTDGDEDVVVVTVWFSRPWKKIFRSSAVSCRFFLSCFYSVSVYWIYFTTL